MQGYRCHNCGWVLSVVVVCVGCEIRDQASPLPETGQPAQVQDGRAGGGIAFVDGYERGYQVARQQQKPIMIFFTAQWCRYCRQMATEAFTEHTVVVLSRRFVCVLVDADDEPNICREFEVRSFPTIQFVSAHGVRLNQLIGQQPPQQLISQMQAVLEAIARRPELSIER